MLGGRHPDIALVPVLVHQHVITADYTHLGVSVQKFDLEPQPVGIAAVIEVLPGDVLPSRLFDPVIDRRGETEPPG